MRNSSFFTSTEQRPGIVGKQDWRIQVRSVVRHENVVAPRLQVLHPANLDLHPDQANAKYRESVRYVVKRIDVATDERVQQQHRARQ